jgi:hypothetical protein
MTDLQRAYTALRDAGHNHDAAIRRLSAETGMDVGSVIRALDRAARGTAWRRSSGDRKRSEASP